MSELINLIAAVPVTQDLLLVLVFLAAFTIIQFLADQAHAPYLNFEEGIFTVYLYIPAKNGSRYQEYRFVRKGDGSFSYVTDRLHPKYFLIGAAVSFVLYIILLIVGAPLLSFPVHGAFLVCLILSVILLFHPVRAWIYLKRQSV